MPYSLTIIELNVQKRKTGMFSTVQGSIIHNCYTARNVIRRRTEALRGNVSSPGVDIINEVKGNCGFNFSTTSALEVNNNESLLCSAKNAPKLFAALCRGWFNKSMEDHFLQFKK